MYLTACTFGSNTANTGGGIWLVDGSLTMRTTRFGSNVATGTAYDDPVPYASVGKDILVSLGATLTVSSKCPAGRRSCLARGFFVYHFSPNLSVNANTPRLQGLFGHVYHFL